MLLCAEEWREVLVVRQSIHKIDRFKRITFFSVALRSNRKATPVLYQNSKTEFTDHGVSIPLRMPTSSNVRLFVLGGFAIFLYYYTIVYIIIFFFY